MPEIWIRPSESGRRENVMELMVKGLKKAYGKMEALKGISFSVKEGIYGLLGPNGAGKSTLIGILTGNLKADEGAVYWNGKNIVSDREAYLKELGYVPQQQALYPAFTVKKYLSYIAALKDMDREYARERMCAVLETMELAAVSDAKIKTLSGGMKQRLMIAQALLDDPPLLILDEPTVGLDPKQRINIRDYLYGLSERKVILIATHIVSDLEYVAKKIVLMNKGEVVRMADSGEGQYGEMAASSGAINKKYPQASELEQVYLYYFGENGQ